MYQIKNLPDGSTEAEERRREGSVRSTVGPVGTEEGHRDRGAGAQPRVSCGALKHRQGIGPKNGTEEHLRGRGMGPRMRTKARPRSQGGEPAQGRRFRAEHRVMGPRTGAEEENQGEAEEPRRRTEARPKVSCGAPRRRQGAEEEHQGEAEEPRTAEAEEVTKQEHHRGQGRDRAGAMEPPEVWS
jgi:hypothetical protein